MTTGDGPGRFPGERETSVSAARDGADVPGAPPAAGSTPSGPAATGVESDGAPALSLDRHLVLEQLGGWRGMVDASLPTIAFIVANTLGGLRTGVWAAVGTALLLFVLRLVRRESMQQAVSGLFAVGVAVAIAAASGQARNFFVPGLVRNAAIGVVLLGSIAFRRPLVGVIAEFLAPSHLGTLSSASLPGLGRGTAGVRTALRNPPTPDPGERGKPDPEPERHWRDDPRMLRAYTWLTMLWAATFLVRVAVLGLLYLRNEVGLLGTATLVLGLPVTAVAVAVTIWTIARLHRHRSPA